MNYTATEIQQRIERGITNGRGYDINSTSNIPFELQKTEIGLQLALLNMDVRDGRISFDSAIGEGLKVKSLIEKLNEAGFPLEIITSAEGFYRAVNNRGRKEPEIKIRTFNEKLRMGRYEIPAL